MRASDTIKKLRMITAAEAGQRSLCLARQQVDRLRGRWRGHSLPPVRLPERCFSSAWLREMLEMHLIPGSRTDINSFVRTRFPHWIPRAEDNAERLCDHRFHLFGYGEVRVGPTVEWSSDPVTGLKWGRRFWADFDPVREPEAGDPKTTLELNRHQHLMTLGRAYFYLGNERYASEALSQMESWSDQNPVGLTINWQSSLEVAFRALAWLWTLALISSSPQFLDGRIRAIARLIADHLNHISRYLSLYSSPNTHLTGEALALYVGGTIFSDFEQGESWRDLGEGILLREAGAQILPDGFHAELSTCYHCYTLDFYLIAMAIARRSRPHFIDAVSERVELMLEALLHMTRSDGSVLRVGDDDGGRALLFDEYSYANARPLFSTGAVYFGDARFRERADTFSEHSLWLLGTSAHDVFERILPKAAGLEAQLFSIAGYFSARSGVTSAATHLLFDCGGLGFIGGGHGHADALSILLSAGGQPLLVDAGTGVYNAAPKWRSYFRGTRAHNTVVVDGYDQAMPAGTFQWSSSINCQVHQQVSMGDMDYVEASHDGYARLRYPVIHRRRILRVGTEYWVVADDFQGEPAGHRFEHLLHFMPSTTVTIAGENSRGACVVDVVDGGSVLQIGFTSSGYSTPSVVSGQHDPPQGWYSPQYGEIVPSPVFTATVSSVVPAAALTVLKATIEDGRWPARFHTYAISGLAACEVEQNGVQDLIVLSATRNPVRIGEFELHGEFFWIRHAGGKVLELFCANASHAAVRGQILLESPSPEPWFRRIFQQAGNRPAEPQEGSVHVRH